MVDLRRSLVITFFSSSGASLLKFVVSVILARILSPDEIGVYSMTVVIVNIAHSFREFGVGTYLQREPDLTPDKLRSAIGVAFGFAWVIALVLFLASDALAAWFKEPDIGPVMRVLAIGFLFIPFGAVTHALLTREFAAGKQALVNAAGTISFCVSCVTLAMLGFGSVGLAWANLINILVCALVYIPLRPKGLPILPGFKHWRSVVHFGLSSLVSNCATQINNAVPDILLGKLGGARQVGLLSRATSTVTIFTYVAGATVNYGAIAYMAQSHHRGESLAPVLGRATGLLTAVGWPALALTAVLGHDVILALYGPAWLDSVSSILPLAIAGCVALVFNYSPHAFAAIGRPYLGALPTVAMLAARIGFGFWLYDGTLASFAWGICLATVATIPVMTWQQHRYFQFGALATLRCLAPSAVVTLGCVLAAELALWVVPAGLSSVSRLLIMALPLAAVWYAGLRLAKHDLLPEVHRMAFAVKNRVMQAI